MYKFKLLLSSLILVAICQGGWAQSTNAGKLLHQYLFVQQKRIGFNGVVLVSKNGQLVYKEMIGQASVEMNTPLNVNSVFKIASVTKSFTAMLMMVAVQDGRVKLNDSLVTFFPDLKDPLWRNITVEQLLSHKSGIAHNEGITDYLLFKSLLALNKQQALAEIFKTKLLFTPGTSVKYSSPGYFLLAAILERVYYENYDTILKEKITQPLGMGHTGIATTRLIIPNMVSSYHLIGDSLIVAPYRDFSLMKGSGDMYASAGDLLKWTNSFAGEIWGTAIKAQIFAPHSGLGLNSEGDRYGYGWYIRSLKGNLKTAYYHGGGTYGCSAMTVWYPDEKISVVILSNVSVLPVNELWADIEKIIFKQPFKLPAINSKLALNAAQLKQFEGHYSSSDGKMELDMIINNNQLYTKLGNNPAFEIYPESAFGFYGKKVSIKFTFRQNSDGFIIGLVADGRGQIITFNKSN
jgi:CubicO group peptidase (beta-lactamase class C family)